MIDAVPLEILEIIVSHLDQRDVSHLAMLNHKYRKNLLSRLYNNPCITSLSGLAKFGSSALTLGFADLIETIDLSNIPNRWNLFTDKSAKVLLTNFPSLKYLDLSNCRKLTNASMKYVSECRQLETLVLSGCIRITSVAPLDLCSQIRFLDLSLCYRVKDFNSIFKLHKLEYLNVSGTKFRDYMLSNMFKMQYLKQIDISKCYNIIYYDRNKPENLEIITDSLEPGEVDWDNAEIDDDINVFPVE